MKLETELNIVLTEFFRPIMAQCLQEVIEKIKSSPVNIPNVNPYGDFNWLRSICPGVPASTLRIKSAAGDIPGVVKFGKRVLYDKTIVLNWLKRQTRQSTPDASDFAQGADEQIENQLAKRRNKAMYNGNNPRSASKSTKLKGNHGDL